MEMIAIALTIGYNSRETPMKHIYKPVNDSWGIGIIGCVGDTIPKHKDDVVDVVGIPNDIIKAQDLDQVRLIEDCITFNEALIGEHKWKEIIERDFK